MDALLRLVFPAVVRIRDGKIMPQNALEQQFGAAISTLRDLPDEKPDGRTAQKPTTATTPSTLKSTTTTTLYPTPTPP